MKRRHRVVVTPTTDLPSHRELAEDTWYQVERGAQVECYRVELEDGTAGELVVRGQLAGFAAGGRLVWFGIGDETPAEIAAIATPART